MTRKQKRELIKNNKAFKDLLKVINSYFKDLIPRMKEVKDHRHNSYIVYNTAELLFPMLMADVMTIGRMRGMTESFNKEECIENFKIILNNSELAELPHHDTINDFLKLLESEELEKIRKYMIGQIFKKRSFEKYRYQNKYWLVIVDGTGIHSFKERHCEHCLTKKFENKETKEVKTIYYHSVLEAKLVLGDYVFSIGTEFIENEYEDISKQDCERKAFERLAAKVKNDYKRLPILLLGDALYAVEPVRTICKANNWAYLIRYKSGCSKTLYEEYEMVKKIERNIKTSHQDDNEYIYEWVNDIAYQKEKINIEELTINNTNGDKEKHFMYQSSLKITPKKVEELIAIGRRRWKIENEGFNVQKQHGYELEHIYCYDYQAMKNHYLLIQMAHMIRQIYDHASKVVKQLKLSIKKESLRLLNSLRSIVLTTEELLEIQESTSQLRLE